MPYGKQIQVHCGPHRNRIVWVYFVFLYPLIYLEFILISRLRGSNKDNECFTTTLIFKQYNGKGRSLKRLFVGAI